MRYMSSNKKLIILSVLVLLCLFGFYKVVNYYHDKDNEILVKEKKQDNINLADELDEEIILGDERVNCGKIDYSACKSYCADSSDQNMIYACRYCRAQQTKCLDCSGKNTYKQDGKCYRGKCEISVSISKKAVSTGKIYVVTYNVSKSCGGATVVYTNATGSVSEVSGSGSFNVTANACGEGSGVTLKSKNSDPEVSNGASIGVRGIWKSNGDTGTCQDGVRTASAADTNGVDKYYSYSSATGCFSVEHARSCDLSGGGSSAKYACYGNASKISLATKVNWQNGKSTGYPTLISGVSKKEDCVVNKMDNYCEPTNIAVPPQEKTANVCEDSVTITSKDGLDCDGKKFYSIICNNETSTSFDNGDDNDLTTTTNKLLVGQGFKYGIKITTKRNCTAVFNATNWKEAYKVVTDQINKINNDLKKATTSEKTQLEKELALYQQKQKDLKDIVTKYNNYDPIKAYEEASSLSINYYANKQPKTLDANFEMIVVQTGNGTYSDKKIVDLGTSGVTNPYNYTWKSDSNPRIIKLIPAKTYIDEKTGEVSTAGLDGGNKVYVDYNIDPGTYILDIDVTGVGGDNSVKNNKCEIKVEKEDIIYRPIDVSNPFINNQWTPGSNWVNSQFDFRNIIHDDIWTGDNCYSKYVNGVWTKCN